MLQVMKRVAAYVASWKRQPTVETPSPVDAIVRMLKEKQAARQKGAERG